MTHSARSGGLLRGATALGVLVAAGALASPAVACDRGFCGNFGFALPVDGAKIPANAPGLLWTPIANRGEASAEDLSLVRVDGGQMSEIEVSVAPFDSTLTDRFFAHLSVLPEAPFEDGGRYELVTSSTLGCGEDEVAVAPAFEVGPAAELPVSLGTLCVNEIAEEDLQVAEDGGCAHTQSTVRADLGLALDASAQPWADLLVFETVVDGEAWLPMDISGEIYQSGSSWVGRGVDRIFAICNENPYSEGSFLLPGEHTVQFRATLPGSDLVLETEVVSLSLVCGDLDATTIAAPRCADLPDVDPDPFGCEANPESPGCEGEAPPVENPQGETTSEGSEGCSVSSPGGQTPSQPGALGLFALLAAVVLSCRRRCMR